MLFLLLGLLFDIGLLVILQRSGERGERNWPLLTALRLNDLTLAVRLVFNEGRADAVVVKRRVVCCPVCDVTRRVRLVV